MDVSTYISTHTALIPFETPYDNLIFLFYKGIISRRAKYRLKETLFWFILLGKFIEFLYYITWKSKEYVI